MDNSDNYKMKYSLDNIYTVFFFLNCETMFDVYFVFSNLLVYFYLFIYF